MKRTDVCRVFNYKRPFRLGIANRYSYSVILFFNFPFMNNSAIHKFNLQPTDLSNEFVTLVPVTPDDFEKLYEVASDPLIWEQHPTRNRYQREVFEIFFNGAITSKGAFVVYDTKTGEPVGSSRYYKLDKINSTVRIGYTFIARRCWGIGYNNALKSLMINYAFNFVDHVIFEIGAVNVRSQKAIEKLGAIKTGEELVTYEGELQANNNYIYEIGKTDWKPAIHDVKPGNEE
jgi:RimJ/RimL family protein N-acetyltransferase